MKATLTFSLTLLPLALAADVVHRDTDLKYEISDFSASCRTEDDYCSYQMNVATSDNPGFGSASDVSETSDDGMLPAVSETQAGMHRISVAKLDNGGLKITIKTKSKDYQGSFTIPSNDLTTKTTGKKTVQSYKGVSDFSVAIGDDSASSTSTSSGSATGSSSDSTASSTATSEPSTTETTAVSSASSADPEETNSAPRDKAFPGILFVFGLLALVF